jgi:hypothetical protein
MLTRTQLRPRIVAREALHGLRILRRRKNDGILLADDALASRQHDQSGKQHRRCDGLAARSRYTPPTRSPAMCNRLKQVRRPAGCQPMTGALQQQKVGSKADLAQLDPIARTRVDL